MEECGSGTSSSSRKPAKVSPPAQPLQIPVDPLLAQSLTKSLEQSVLRSQVTISADEEKGMLVFSPTSQSKPSWQQDCRDQVSQCMANSLTTEDIHVPKEVAARAVSIAVKLQKENPGLTVVPNSDGTVITVAGQTSSMNLAKEAIDSLCSTITDSVTVLLSPEDFDYFQQVKKSDLPSDIACTFEPSKFNVILRGPIGAVTKLKDSIGDFLQHADSPVLLDPLVTEFFRTESGKGKLKKFLQERQCHAALHFSQYHNLTLHLLCDRTNANHVKAVVSQIHLHVRSLAIPIPDAVVPIISDLEDFIQLCQTVEHEHGVLIKHVGHEVSAAGFKAEVTSSLTEISKFLKEKASPLPPSEMKVSTLVGRSLQKAPHGVQKSLQPFHVQFNIDEHRGMLQFTPLHYLKPGWEEDCKSSVSEYIQSHIAEVKIQVPEKAYSDIMTALYSSEQEDNTFVFSYPPYSLALAIAGEKNMVKAVEYKIARVIHTRVTTLQNQLDQAQEKVKQAHHEVEGIKLQAHQHMEEAQKKSQQQLDSLLNRLKEAQRQAQHQLEESQHKIRELQKQAQQHLKTQQKLQQQLEASLQQIGHTKQQAQQQLAEIQHQLQETQAQLHKSNLRSNELGERALSAETDLNQVQQQKKELQHQLEEALHQQEQSNQRADEQEEKAASAELRLSHSDEVFQDMFHRLIGQMPQSQPYWVVKRNEIHLTAEELGCGGWGSVRVATFRGNRVAAKYLHRQIVSAHNVRLFTREMNMAANARHPNLLQFIGATLDSEEPIILTELMPTSLRQVLEEGTRLTHPQIVSVSRHVALALNYLHLMQPEAVIHRDVSSANVLLEPLPGNTWKAKLSDYGSANFIRHTTTAGPGNPTYAAPEASDPQRQSDKMDVFSFGVLLVEMCSGELAPSEHRDRLLASVQWPAMVALIRRCLKPDTQRRPDVSTIIVELEQIR